MLPRTTMTAKFAVAAALAFAGAADAETVTLTETDCRRLVVEHTPGADVAYREGVDVRGRPVAPADLPGSRRLRLRDTYTFDIEVRPLAPRPRDPLRLGRATSLSVGTVVVTPDGRVFFDGQPLHDETQRALAAACREAGAG